MAGCAFRPFGLSKGDLDIDFDSPRPKLVSDVLGACFLQTTRSPDDRAALETLSVGERLAMLIKIVQAGGVDFLVAKLTCNAPECVQTFELEIDLSALCSMHHQARQVESIEVDLGGKRVLLRRPTAKDQDQWRLRDYPDSQLAAEQMLRSLVVESEVDLISPIPVTIVDAIEEAMQKVDPLMAPNVECECPHCGHWQEQRLDTGGLLLRSLQEIQTGMIEAIHLLAKSYHWSEDQILALSAKRRGQYLNLIHREG